MFSNINSKGVFSSTDKFHSAALKEPQAPARQPCFVILSLNHDFDRLEDAFLRDSG